MEKGYKIVKSFVSGNALGVVIEPIGATGDESQRSNSWEIRIGRLVTDVAYEDGFPMDVLEVVDDLREFLHERGISFE